MSFACVRVSRVLVFFRPKESTGSCVKVRRCHTHVDAFSPTWSSHQFARIFPNQWKARRVESGEEVVESDECKLKFEPDLRCQVFEQSALASGHSLSSKCMVCDSPLFHKVGGIHSHAKECTLFLPQNHAKTEQIMQFEHQWPFTGLRKAALVVSGCPSLHLSSRRLLRTESAALERTTVVSAVNVFSGKDDCLVLPWLLASGFGLALCGHRWLST